MIILIALRCVTIYASAIDFCTDTLIWNRLSMSCRTNLETWYILDYIILHCCEMALLCVYILYLVTKSIKFWNGYFWIAIIISQWLSVRVSNKYHVLQQRQKYMDTFEYWIKYLSEHKTSNYINNRSWEGQTLCSVPRYPWFTFSSVTHIYKSKQCSFKSMKHFKDLSFETLFPANYLALIHG